MRRHRHRPDQKEEGGKKKMLSGSHWIGEKREDGWWLMRWFPHPWKRRGRRGSVQAPKRWLDIYYSPVGKVSYNDSGFCAKMEASKKINSDILFFSNGERMNKAVLWNRASKQGRDELSRICRSVPPFRPQLVCQVSRDLSHHIT